LSESEGTFNDQLNNLIKKKNIISYIKAPRLGWFDHVDQMTNKRTVKKSCDLKPILSTGLTGRANIRWENDMKEDLRIVKINNWTKCTQERVKWKEDQNFNCSAR
jgi:hypothetical protein